MKKLFKITEQNSRQRLDKFLTNHFPNYSRAFLQKQIKSGGVLVNRQVRKSSYILKESDKIETKILPPEKISLEPNASLKLNIIYEDKDVIVINKPAGLTTHPSQTQKSGTLANALLAYHPLLKNVGEDSMRPGIVHRLDKDTSGLMIIAKNQNAFDRLKNQFQERKVVKKYLALVNGRLEKPSGEIRAFISRSKSDPTRQKITTVQEGKEAITLYKAIKEYKKFTLIEARPKTGRMHQIRVHLKWLGHPIVGDQKYGNFIDCPPNLKRQFLHAAYLKIKLPDGQTKEFNAPLPKDLNDILRSLE